VLGRKKDGVVSERDDAAIDVEVRVVVRAARAGPGWSEAAGAYNTTRTVRADASGPEVKGWVEDPGWVVERLSRQAADAYDLQVLPSHTMYEFLAERPEGTWLPLLVSDQDVNGRRVQRLGFAGESADGTDAASRRAAEVAFAECMDSLARIDTTELERWQAANITTWSGGPATWDAARRARLFDLWQEAYRRVPDLFGRRGPGLEQLWERLESKLPPTGAVAPARPLHNDGKYGNIVRPDKATTSSPKAHLIPDTFHKVIDWDLLALTYLDPRHASVVDLVRLLHLTGRNPLVVRRGLWLPTAHAWAHTTPEARSAVDGHRRPTGPIAAEAIYQLALSGAIDTHRATDGTVPTEYAVTAGNNLLLALGFDPAGHDEHTARLTRAHTAAPGASLPGADPVHGPPRRDDPRSHETVATQTAMRQTVSAVRLGAAWQALAQYVGADHESRLATARALTSSLAAQMPGERTANGPFVLADLSAQALHLAERTAAALSAGITAGHASPDDPAGWAALPRMPSQARTLIRTHFPRPTTDTGPPAPHRSAAAVRTAPPPAPQAAGFASLRRTARQMAEQLRTDGVCAWNPTAAISRETRGRSLRKTMRLD
jgi:hypothetical protein